MVTKKCIVCGSEFDTVHNGKTCSEPCRRQHRIERRKHADKTNLLQHTCTVCGALFERNKYKAGLFCSRSCASKHYISIGTYDPWRLRAQEKQGFMWPCAICGKELYTFPRFNGKTDLKRVCSSQCRALHMSSVHAGENNPRYGKKAPDSQKQKQRDTLLKRYGVTNAYDLAVRRTYSKQQRNLAELITTKWENKTILVEHRLVLSDRTVVADFLFPKERVIVEYMGDYWHCNPNKYEASYHHKRKSLTAEQIWAADTERKATLESAGYTVIEVWETEFLADRHSVLAKLEREIAKYESVEPTVTTKETQNPSSLGPSINCLVDVKLGELLETPQSLVCNNVAGNGEREC